MTTTTTTSQITPTPVQSFQSNNNNNNTNLNVTAAESAAISFTNTAANSIPLTQQPITQNNKPTPAITNISKLEHDSLAPLSIPSKPIVYMPETNVNINATTSKEQTNLNEENKDEKSKLESILFSSMNQQQLIKPDMLRGANNWQPRMPNMMNMQQIRPQQPMQLRPTYICTICKKPGHPKSLCPEAGTLPKPEERPKFPSGIPKNKMRVARPDDKFAMLGPDGYVVPEIEYQVAQTVKKDKTPFLTEEEEEEEKRKNLELSVNGTNGLDSFNKYPPELKCPFGDHIIKDAVLIPCCGHFICCDECIKKKITNDEYVECPHKDCDQEIGSLESITPYHDIRKRVNEYLSDLKLATQRATNLQNSNNSLVKTITNTTNDPFLEELLNDVNNESSKENSNFEYDDIQAKNSPNNEKYKDDELDEDRILFGAHSPLQDSKISSSEAAAALIKQQLNLTENASKLNEKQEPSLNESSNELNKQQPAPVSALLPTPPNEIFDSKILQQPPPNLIPNSVISKPVLANPIFPLQNEVNGLQQPPPPFMPRNPQMPIM
jgi:hypothetical protein